MLRVQCDEIRGSDRNATGRPIVTFEYKIRYPKRRFCHTRKCVTAYSEMVLHHLENKHTLTIRLASGIVLTLSLCTIRSISGKQPFQ